MAASAILKPEGPALNSGNLEELARLRWVVLEPARSGSRCVPRLGRPYGAKIESYTFQPGERVDLETVFVGPRTR